MFNSFFKILIRNATRNKKTFLINILGLTIGLTCFFLIYLFVQYENSYDKMHKDYKDIYRIVMKQPGNIYQGTDLFNVTPSPLQTLLKEEFPEIKNATRVNKWEHLVQFGQNSFIEDRFLYVDPDFLNIFSFKLLTGNPNEVFKKPYTVVLSQKTAEKYFGDINPVGKTLIIDAENEYEITGIIENAPDNSHLQYDFLASYSTQILQRPKSQHWNNNSSQTYIRLSSNRSIKELENIITEAARKYKGNNNKDLFIIQALSNIHLYAKCNFELEKNGDIIQVRTFFVIGILILLIACFNYVNLTSANSLSRSKELGIKKVIGANKKQIFFQLIGESFIHALISTLIAIMVIGFVIHFFENIIPIKFSLSFLFNIKILLGLFFSIIIASLISGIVPTLFIVRFQTVQILKNKLHSNSDSFFSIRSVFVVSQFVISISLIIGTISTYQQLRFLQNKDLGFKTNNIITTYIKDVNCREQNEILKRELLTNPDIFDVTVSNFLPNNILSSTGATLEGEPDKIIRNIYRAQVDHNFFDFYGISMKEGTDFSDFMNTNKDLNILNKTAIEEYNIENPVGKTLITGDRNIKGEIVGIINDIHFSPLNLKLCPLAISNLQSENYSHDARYISIKINPDKFESTISFVRDKFKEFSPDYPFDYSFLSNNIESVYANEKSFQMLFRAFSIIAICIACLGLLGLATYNLEKRIKEIGVRKVSGANLLEILALINKDYLIWITISMVIAVPLSKYIIDKWLQNYAYHIKINSWIYIFAGIITLLIALITVSWQSWRAARRNPVEALRYE